MTVREQASPRGRHARSSARQSADHGVQAREPDTAARNCRTSGESGGICCTIYFLFPPSLTHGGRLHEVLAMPLREADHHVDAVISLDVLRSYAHCRYKAYLKLSNQVGVQRPYDAALAELRAEAKQRALGKLGAAGSAIPDVRPTHAPDSVPGP
jgi:hypothetical protein